MGSKVLWHWLLYWRHRPMLGFAVNRSESNPCWAIYLGPLKLGSPDCIDGKRAHWQWPVFRMGWRDFDGEKRGI